MTFTWPRTSLMVFFALWGPGWGLLASPGWAACSLPGLGVGGTLGVSARFWASGLWGSLSSGGVDWRRGVYSNSIPIVGCAKPWQGAS